MANKQDRLKGSKVVPYPIPYSVFGPSQKAIRTWENEKVIGEDITQTWDYSINEYGFRWNIQNKPKILFNGCSHTFGQGVKQNDIFGEIICREYLENTVECMNLGMPGSGPQIQNTNLLWALNTFDDIECVVWYMSSPIRQILVQLDQIHTYHPGYLGWFHDKKFAKSLEKSQPHLWQTVKLNTYWMLYSTFSLLQQKGIKLLFRCWDPECHLDFRRLHSYFKYTEIPDLPKLDHGRDWEHRGPKSHRRLAEGIWEVWNES